MKSPETVRQDGVHVSFWTKEKGGRVWGFKGEGDDLTGNPQVEQDVADKFLAAQLRGDQVRGDDSTDLCLR